MWETSLEPSREVLEVLVQVLVEQLESSLEPSREVLGVWFSSERKHVESFLGPSRKVLEVLVRVLVGRGWEQSRAV